MTRFFAPAMLAALALAALIGCDSKKNNDPPAPAPASGRGASPDAKKYVIAVIPKGTSHVFWQSVHAGANRAARELGIPDPLWQGPPSEKEVTTQVNIVNDMLVKKVDAIVLAPINQTTLVTPIEAAFAKMPIVIFDSGAATDKFTAFCATDNEKGGRLAGEYMLKLLGPEGGQVAMVPVQAGSQSTGAREKGFEDALKANPKVVLIKTQYGNSNLPDSQNAARDAIVKTPNLKGFFGPNESSARGILGALEEKGLAGKVKFVGFDSGDELAAGLDSKKIDALVLQDPVRMGYDSVKAAYAALRGEKVAKDQPIEPQLVTQENKDTPQMQQLLRPDLKDLK